MSEIISWKFLQSMFQSYLKTLNLILAKSVHIPEKKKKTLTLLSLVPTSLCRLLLSSTRYLLASYPGSFSQPGNKASMYTKASYTLSVVSEVEQLHNNLHA